MKPEEEHGWACRDQTKIDKYGEQLAYSTIYSSIFGDKMPASETPCKLRFDFPGGKYHWC